MWWMPLITSVVCIKNVQHVSTKAIKTKFYATKSQAISILVFIHLSFIYQETEGIMPQLLTETTVILFLVY